MKNELKLMINSFNTQFSFYLKEKIKHLKTTETTLQELEKIYQNSDYIHRKTKNIKENLHTLIEELEQEIETIEVVNQEIKNIKEKPE